MKCCLGLVLLCCCCTAGADPPSTTQPAPAEIYTLFNPVPENQLRPMDTDRPNQTNTPHTIDAGHLQIETGFFQYNYDRDLYQGANSRSYGVDVGQFNFRLGVLPDLELNAIVDSWNYLDTTDLPSGHSTRQNGFGDTIVGGKLNFWGNDCSDAVWASGLGIQPQFKIPTAPQPLGNGHAELFVGLPFLINLPAGFHLGLQPTVSWERNSTDNGDVTGLQNSASIDRVFFERLDIYLEYWSHVSTEHHQEAQQTCDVGFTLPATDNIVLDAGFNLGLNKASSTIEVLAGISVRF